MKYLQKSDIIIAFGYPLLGKISVNLPIQNRV